MSGVSRSVKNGRCWACLRRIPGKSRRQIFPGCSSSQQMLPAIRHVAGDNFVFQQDSAPAHRACDAVELLQRETADFISPELWPPNSPDPNPVDYKIWGIMQKRVYEMQIHNVDKLKRRLVDVWSERSAAKCCWRCCQRVEKASAGVCSHEGRTFRTPAVGCFDSGTKLSIDSPCTTCFWNFQWNNHMTLSEKMVLLCLSVLQGSAETLFRWGGKINHLSIALTLSNTCAKDYWNRKIFVQVTAKNVGGVFLRHTVYNICSF